MARRKQKRGRGGGERVTPKEVRRRRASSNRERRLLIGAGVVVAAILIILAFGFYRERVAASRAPVAVVNGQPVRLQDYQARVRYERFSLLNTFGGQIELQQLIPFLRDQLPPALLDTMIEEAFVKQYAEEAGIAVEDAEVQTAIEEQLGFTGGSSSAPASEGTVEADAPVEETASAAPSPTREDFEQAYQQYIVTVETQAGVTEQAFRDIVRTRLLRDQVRAAITQDVPTTAPQIQHQRILVETEEEAQAARQRLLDGEDFATVAEEVSQESATATGDGEGTWSRQTDLPAAIREPAANLPIGEISDPIEATNGFYIVEVLGREEDRPLTELQLQQARDDRFRQWLSEQSATADIERLWTPEDVPPLPPELQAAQEAPQPPVAVTAEPVE
jgi:peptidyl-prolyl cis-trans isomerase SurA